MQGHVVPTSIPKTAIIVLSCTDFRALEVTLTCLMSFTPSDTPCFVLQNCRGSFDAEQSLKTAERYARLHAGRITVITEFQPDWPYHTIARFLQSDHATGFDRFCKIDDDCYPIAPGWLEALERTAESGKSDAGAPLAYVTPLINNNTWGFAQTLDIMGLRERYLEEVATPHYVGPPKNRRIARADEIETGMCGTIWGNPSFARWLHRETTLQPEAFIAATKGQTVCKVRNRKRYSIGCILFEKPIWFDMFLEDSNSDEGMMHRHCADTGKRILCDRSVPFVHLHYYVQREENADITEVASKVYQRHCAPRFRISAFSSKQHELEARLRHLEERMGKPSGEAPAKAENPDGFRR